MIMREKLATKDEDMRQYEKYQHVKQTKRRIE
jgi:hypothetical protein